MALKMKHTEAWFMKRTLLCAAGGKHSLERASTNHTYECTILTKDFYRE